MKIGAIARRRWRSAAGRLFALASLAALGGCFAPQVHHTVEVRVISLEPGDLESHGIAFIILHPASCMAHRASCTVHPAGLIHIKARLPGPLKITGVSDTTREAHHVQRQLAGGPLRTRIPGS
jgi:hypothetical protein